MNLDYFKEQDQFYKGLQTLFDSLNIPVNYIDDKPLKPQDILSKTYKDTNPAYQLMSDVYILGMVDDKAFSSSKSADISEIKNNKKGYDGILIFGVTLTDRANGLLPTRTQLAEITRAFNREFYYTPVVVLFRYDNFISLANAERQKYKQEWREGEKAGKVSILRDIEIENPHTGHLKILEELKITRSGKKGINSFEGLYQYWQEVFSVNLLNKKFYSELSNWYFWAIKHVSFPSESIYIDDKNHQHKAQNIIRLLTRLLFVWFIKEKKLIPEELFDLETLQKNILKKISPFRENESLFEEEESIYYKAILQNLFYATLNCPVKPDSIDIRERGFRGEGYGQHRGIDYLMRYKKYFKDPDAFLEMVNKVVPFLNGGLFECLDDKYKNIYIDGFSDNMSKTDGVANNLVVPDYLFFGKEEKTDLSSDYGTKNRGAKEAGVKGLINILKSYKFTIAENTPIEEDVALDPELLGKVFENLLASYNPETKTTARKQTGSFYTPREIVNYMVDESLIAHLKNSVSNWDMEEKELDDKLHQLLSFEPANPFENNTTLSRKIINSLDNCKVLDPACGSGAFPMGILQKMVHILQKVDPNNEYWQELQLEKAEKATKGVFVIKDKEERKQLLDEINEAFDQSINNPDYARKLFLIENCIYGVDIQPIAAQISKLRFFISLVVEQKVNKKKDNFGIRPLPNLETKFVTANTLIGIDKPDGELFYTKEVQEKEAELKAIRHKLFGAKTKATKVKYRKKDEELRNEIADILKKGNLPVESAEQLAGWDPYDQNGVSPFFDPEWMFDVKDGFDVVIGNPPYLNINKLDKKIVKYLSEQYDTIHTGYNDIVYYFMFLGIKMLRKRGCSVLITSNYFLGNEYAQRLRQNLGKHISKIVNFKEYMVFDAASVHTCISVSYNTPKHDDVFFFEAVCDKRIFSSDIEKELNSFSINRKKLNENWLVADQKNTTILNGLKNKSVFLGDISTIEKGPTSGKNKVFTIPCGLADERKLEKTILRRNIKNGDIDKYTLRDRGKLLIYVDNNTLIESYPNVFAYLKTHKKVLENRNEVKKGLYSWYRFERPRKKQIFDAKEKIVVPYRAVMNRFAYDNQQYFNDGGDIRAIIINEDEFNIKYVLAILNSKLIDWYYGFIGKPKGKTREYFNKPLSLIPIKKIPKFEQQPLIILVDIIISDKKTNSRIHDLCEHLIDAIIFELYFPDHMKERKIDVLQFVKKDIEKVMQDKEFETLNDTQKEQIIAELHTRWSDPNSEIVKRMNSFSEKSPEILKPILEG
ncbi:conserved hypothetical protein [Desulfamplus magnetovallimortis]|uniref:site-specific DNA-methyltransferase (adenine-specific) n=1 Tax=Desulfamplus magnetovallimortis TaxID=1246637 RepID=A0A1W1HH68_9BACT|nr:TaqI-like C-terminal specificity domain-containing protein [Desulfamplus magnetovallimortis]SLM31847.1 conserved hypothetical protein [Desulfamplus magnetovallimortis]